MVFFTSDTHLGHLNICEGTSNWSIPRRTRNFSTIHEMDSAIINNINSVVGEDDILYHLGDFSFGGHTKIESYRNRINCKNIHLVLGNHDEQLEKNYTHLFTSVNKYLNIKLKDFRFVLFHYPTASWDGLSKGNIHLHGHVHLPSSEKLRMGCKMMDVGVDGNNLKPYSFDEIIEIMEGQPIGSMIEQDHHF